MSKRKPWTPAEVEVLRRFYSDNSTAEVAAMLGRDAKSTYAKANALGLFKSDAFMSSASSGRIMRGRTHPAMIATQFKKGLIPWNKGTKGTTGLHPNCRRTQFKKGEMSGAAQHNYVPIGSYRVNKDGHLERKMTDDPAIVPARRWTPVYRLVWEAAHGPIPDGWIVRFKDGMKTAALDEITADRLECITKAENARRNHPARKSPELAKLLQLKGAITRQVNRIKKQEQHA